MRNDLEKDVYKVEVATVFNNMDKKVSKAQNNGIGNGQLNEKVTATFEDIYTVVPVL